MITNWPGESAPRSASLKGAPESEPGLTDDFAALLAAQQSVFPLAEPHVCQQEEGEPLNQGSAETALTGAEMVSPQPVSSMPVGDAASNADRETAMLSAPVRALQPPSVAHLAPPAILSAAGQEAERPASTARAESAEPPTVEESSLTLASSTGRAASAETLFRANLETRLPPSQREAEFAFRIAGEPRPFLKAATEIHTLPEVGTDISVLAVDPLAETAPKGRAVLPSLGSLLAAGGAKTVEHEAEPQRGAVISIGELANTLRSEGASIDGPRAAASRGTSDSQATVERLIEPITIMATRPEPRETRTVRLRLHPEELGQVEIRLAQDSQGALTARLVADNEAARQVLSDGLAHLRDALERAGLEVDRLDVATQPGSSALADGRAGAERGNHSSSPPAAPRFSAGEPSAIDGPPADTDDRLLSLRA